MTDRGFSRAKMRAAKAAAAMTAEALLKRADARVREIQTEVATLGAKRFAMGGFLKALKRQDGLVATFDEAMWYALVDRVVVEDGDAVRYIFKNGAEYSIAY